MTDTHTPSSPPTDDGLPVLRCDACQAVFMGRPGDPCPKCGRAVGEKVGLPWQDRRGKNLSMLRAIALTVLRLHSRPRETFHDFRLGRGYGEPFLFMVIPSLLAVGLALLLPTEVQALYSFAAEALVRYDRWGPPAERLMFANEICLNCLAVGVIAWSWVICLATLTATSVVLRSVRTRLRDRERSMADAFAMVAYAWSGACIWMAVPWCGLPAFAGVFVYILACGYSQVHNVSTIRAILVVLASLVSGVFLSSILFSTLLAFGGIVRELASR